MRNSMKVTYLAQKRIDPINKSFLLHSFLFVCRKKIKKRYVIKLIERKSYVMSVLKPSK